MLFMRWLPAVLRSFASITSSATGSLAAGTSGQALQLVDSLSQRPLELYATPLFSKIVAVITIVSSRMALSVSSDSSMTEREIAELAARAGRTSQRMLFVPIIIAAFVPVSLALMYMTGSLAFLYSEMRTWRSTGRDLGLLRSRHAQPSTTARRGQEEVVLLTHPTQGIAYSADDTDECCICLEPLREDTREGAASSGPALQQPQPRVTIALRMENGPQNRWFGPFIATLEVTELAGAGSEELIPQEYSRRTAHSSKGEWILAVDAGSMYRVRLLGQSPGGRTQELTSVNLAVTSGPAPQRPVAPRGCVELWIGATEQQPATSWPFWGQHRLCPGKCSTLRFETCEAQAASAGAGRPLGWRACGPAWVLGTSGHTRVLEIPPRPLGQPPSPPKPPVSSTEGAVVTLKCGHAFHTTCIKAWLRNSSRCPLCREVVRGRRAQAMQALF